MTAYGLWQHSGVDYIYYSLMLFVAVKRECNPQFSIAQRPLPINRIRIYIKTSIACGVALRVPFFSDQLEEYLTPSHSKTWQNLNVGALRVLSHKYMI